MWENFHPKVVLNFADENDDMDDFFLLGPVAKDLLNVDLEYWGHIRFDDAVRAAIRSQKPEQLLSVTGRATEDIVRMVVRTIISAEFTAADRNSNWFDKDQNVFDLYNEIDSFTCTSKCLLWNGCPHRMENGACSRMTVELSKRVG